MKLFCNEKYGAQISGFAVVKKDNSGLFFAGKINGSRDI